MPSICNLLLQVLTLLSSAIFPSHKAKNRLVIQQLPTGLFLIPFIRLLYAILINFAVYTLWVTSTKLRTAIFILKYIFMDVLVE